MADKPVTREEKYLAYLTGDYTGELPKPITRKEKYLYELCLKGIGGEISPEEIKNAVNEYLEKNPVKPGATTEQAQQIEQNKTDVASLKTAISTKITKFYASSQGETHLVDSDNGKIQDMMLYGKSSQDGTPTPENPVEIKSVVNPTVKVCGKNLFNDDASKWHKYGSYFYYPLDESKTYTMSIVDNSYEASIFSLGFIDDIWSPDSKFTWAINDGRTNYEKITKKGFKYLFIYTKSEDLQTTLNKFKVQLELGSTATAYEPYHEQTVILPYTLNAIPVKSGGNVTINGQQYIADYVDVERGKVVRMCERNTFNTKNGVINEEYRLAIDVDIVAQDDGGKECIFSTFEWTSWGTCTAGTKIYIKNIKKSNNELYTAQELKELGLDFDAIYQLAEKQEIDLTTEQITAFKELVTYYPVTNVSVNSEQLDGYTVFNYPISMANGWNYVKKQLNDNRDYIYDMDTQSAEAYVNSEYAVALTELEV